MARRSKLEWYGPRVKTRAREAQRKGVDKCMAGAVQHAKDNHPWGNVTGTAEGSIRITQFAYAYASGVRGQWGSADVKYFIFLELGTVRMAAKPSLRPAADVWYPRLAGFVREAYGT